MRSVCFSFFAEIIQVEQLLENYINIYWFVRKKNEDMKELCDVKLSITCIIVVRTDSVVQRLRCLLSLPSRMCLRFDTL